MADAKYMLNVLGSSVTPTEQIREMTEHQLIEYARRMRKRAEEAEARLARVGKYAYHKPPCGLFPFSHLYEPTAPCTCGFNEVSA